MALISAKNFVTPLTSMVNVITILLLAICFAVLRLSGAGVALQPVDKRSERNVGTVAPIDTTTSSRQNIDDLFKPAPRVIGNNSSPAALSDRPNDDAESVKRKRLEEIERSLGIR